MPVLCTPTMYKLYELVMYKLYVLVMYQLYVLVVCIH